MHALSGRGPSLLDDGDDGRLAARDEHGSSLAPIDGGGGARGGIVRRDEGEAGEALRREVLELVSRWTRRRKAVEVERAQLVVGIGESTGT